MFLWILWFPLRNVPYFILVIVQHGLIHNVRSCYFRVIQSESVNHRNKHVCLNNSSWCRVSFATEYVTRLRRQFSFLSLRRGIRVHRCLVRPPNTSEPSTRGEHEVDENVPNSPNSTMMLNSNTSVIKRRRWYTSGKLNARSSCLGITPAKPGNREDHCKTVPWAIQVSMCKTKFDPQSKFRTVFQ